MKYEITTRSAAETMQVARELMAGGFPDLLICLDGELGAGKTTFTKGVAEALGVREVITSPTFTIIKEYSDGAMPLYHVDAYRLEGEAGGINIEEYFVKGGVVVIEWPEMIAEVLPEERLEIKIRAGEGETRVLTLVPQGEKYEKLVAGMRGGSVRGLGTMSDGTDGGSVSEEAQ